MTKWDTVETLFLVNSVATTTTLGEKVTTVNLENNTLAQTLKFDKALTAATLGVNNVTGAVNTTVDGAALKTLTVDASGKVSNVTLAQTAATIETLNITGKADLTLATTLATIKTVDGSKAEGKLVLSKLATMTSVKTGSGNDTVTVAAAASGDTINLGAGNDKLVKGAGSVAAGSIIDGGAGIDSLDSDLVNVGNAGVFVSFETISLTAANTASPLDLDLLTKSTITSIDKDGANNHALLNVKKSQALTVNTTTTALTTLTFKASEIAGTADAYTINFNADNATPAFNAGTVTIDGIETVTVNSVGKTGATNLITLEDKAAKSLVITGDKELTVAFGANGFGSNSTAAGDGKGVATIDASASTAGIKITTLANIGIAENGLTIKGGAGADNIASSAAYAKAVTIEAGAGDDKIDTSNLGTTKADIKVNAGAGNDIITVGAVGGTFALGAGNDKIDVTLAKGVTALTTITDAAKGDTITGLAAAAGDLFAKASITGANNLDTALGLAATAGATTWFQYAGDTYIVDSATGTLTAGTDFVVKLNGLVDLGNSSLDVSGVVGSITIA